jgi:hypothetical protein
MSKYTPRLVASVIAAGSILLGACHGESKKGPDSTALGADTSLNRDLALAGRDTTVQPQLHDIPATSAAAPAASAPVRRTTPREVRHEPRRHEQVATAPAPLPPPPAAPTTTTTPSGNTVTTNPAGAANPGAVGGGAVGAIPAGSTLNASASQKVCTNTNAVGDHVTATLADAVTGTNGAMIPAGATLDLTVTQLKKSSNTNDPIVMEFAVNSVSFGGRTYPIDGTVTQAQVTRVRDQSQRGDIEKVAGGAIAGAILGHLIGHSTKGTVIGGAAGAAAGAATAAATASYQGCIDAGSPISVRLNTAAAVKA